MLTNVSVIIPALNAAPTLPETLQSLQAQIFENWEAIVVDDGSTDDTAHRARCVGERDARIHVYSGPHQGVSAARNLGITLARHEWLLFLDADDWIAPTHLERLTGLLASDPDVQLVHCSWAWAFPDGTRLLPQHDPRAMDLFSRTARSCPFPIHACIVRRSLVNGVGGFDRSLRTCEDWDLWQRVARSGGRAVGISEPLALYRVRPNSASANAYQLLTDGLRVIDQGHAPDPRVVNPAPAYRSGLPRTGRRLARHYLACWCAALLLSRRADTSAILDHLGGEACPELNPDGVASILFDTLPFTQGLSPAAWVDLWPRLEESIDLFLTMLENRSRAPGLRRRVRALLAARIFKEATGRLPLRVGETYGLLVDVSKPISDVSPPDGVERVRCEVQIEGDPVGTIELPVIDGTVSSYVLTDAIAGELAWPILERFFEQTVYRELQVGQMADGRSIRRGAVQLTPPTHDSEEVLRREIHGRAGWTVFLQELWGRRDWPPDRFYDPKAVAEPAPRRTVDSGRLTLEVSDVVPEVEPRGSQLDVVLTVGGVAIGTVAMSAEREVIGAQELQVASTRASGFELCRAAVREALLGRPFSDGGSLRDRLAVAAAVAATSRSKDGEVAEDGAPMLGGSRALASALHGVYHPLVLARRRPGDIDSSLSRRAILPAAVASDLIEAISVCREPLAASAPAGVQPTRVLYAPELVPDTSTMAHASSTAPTPESSIRGPHSSTSAPPRAATYGRHSFEEIFARGTDPWQSTSAYAQLKYQQTLALLPPTPIARALELGCAEGHFTEQLAHRVGSLVAADISKIALDRAAHRCAQSGNTSFVHLDLSRDPLPGRFDLIVCGEVLCFLEDRAVLREVAHRIADALVPDGYLLSAHANLVADEPDRTGLDWDLSFGAKQIAETFAQVPSLRLIREHRTPLHRIQLLQRQRRVRLPFHRRAPAVIEERTLPTPLPSNLAASVLWGGGARRAHHPDASIATDRLPILMYHRIASEGAGPERYRVTPERFEEQLAYLREAGYHSVTLADWRKATETHTPLPGRAVLLTFDDGYADFMECAWPLLQRAGFSALSFVVAGKVGQTNDWDAVHGEQIPLLGWRDIRKLRDEGVEFGSHAMTHVPLTSQTVATIVREAVQSRTVLRRELGTAIDAFAYPVGDEDPVVRHLIGAAGFVFGLTCREALTSLWDPLLTLPRIELTGSDALQAFVRKINGFDESRPAAETPP